MRFQHQAVIVLAVAPAVWLAYRALNGMLGVNPVEDLLLTTGLWAFRFLLLSLAVTPLRRMTGWNRVIHFRRMLGLFAFFYACLHLATYVVLDQGLELRFILADVAKRPFITAGMTAFLLMFPLAATSTRGADSASWAALAGASPAGLCQRRSRGAAFHLEGQGGRRRAGLLWRRADPAPGVPGAQEGLGGVSRPAPTRSGITY